MGRAPFFEADCWHATRWGWCAQLSLPWTEAELRGFNPERIAIDYIAYTVVDTEIVQDGDRLLLMVYTLSELDVTPDTPFVQSTERPDRVE
jgi:hypothetical protein